MNTSREQELHDLLNEHIRHAQALLALIREERQWIIHNQLDKLSGAIEEKARIQSAMALLEEKRLALMPALCAPYSLPATVKLDVLSRAVEEPYATLFREKQRQLGNVIRAIRAGHESNRLLMQKSLDFHERAFKLILGLTEEKIQYQASGEMKRERKSLIDSKA